MFTLILFLSCGAVTNHRERQLLIQEEISKPLRSGVTNSAIVPGRASTLQLFSSFQRPGLGEERYARNNWVRTRGFVATREERISQKRLNEERKGPSVQLWRDKRSLWPSRVKVHYSLWQWHTHVLCSSDKMNLHCVYLCHSLLGFGGYKYSKHESCHLAVSFYWTPNWVGQGSHFRRHTQHHLKHSAADPFLIWWLTGQKVNKDILTLKQFFLTWAKSCRERMGIIENQNSK